MKTGIIHISEKIQFNNAFRSVISFKKFVEFLKLNFQKGAAIKRPYFKWIIRKFKRYPELSEAIPLGKIHEYEEILELVSTCLLPLAADEKSLWALCSPLAPQIFYGTDGIHELMDCLKHPVVFDPSMKNPDDESEKILQELQYGMVLEKIYELPFLKKTEWIRKFADPETGLDRYFQVHIDTRFVEIQSIGGKPDMDCSHLTPASVWGEEFKKIRHLIPLNRFEARGFSVITLTEVTAEEAVKEVAKLVIHNSQTDKRPLFEEVTHALQNVVGSRNFEFGIVPFLTINERPALIYDNFPYSIIVRACFRNNVPKKEFASLRNDYTENPRTIVWTAREREKELPPVISEAFIQAGIRNYLMFPVLHNGAVTGIFEIATRQEQPMLSEEQLVRLKPVLPIMSQLIQNIVARFNRNIDEIIKEKFTSIQPAVQWKFNETAWHYQRDHFAEDRNKALENIVFNNLHPLYGEIDIKNSTILRNEALKKDFSIQLYTLTEAIGRLDYRKFQPLERILKDAENWQAVVRDSINTQQEIRLNEFFNLEVQYELENLIHTVPETAEALIPYFESTDEQKGVAFENRRRLEAAIGQINTVVNDFFENASGELQQIFPCYFEKFRTDGVEYDIYVGQSIAPNLPFQKSHLQEMKRWQLESMVRVVRLVQEIGPDLVFQLETTQLLFVHPQTIDISFRKDERRFDVEGSYNIRYHIIKKRIDKVVLKNSSERLTQPGKIALVYFDDRDAIEYKGYIRKLQEDHLLAGDLEELELEALQGVDGLKALRVGILTGMPMETPVGEIGISAI